MNSNAKNAMPFKKRSNPFENPVVETREEPVPKATIVEKRPVVPTQRREVVQDDAARLKYTATMDKDLHKRLKIAAAVSGIQISSFIEEAILEKLEKEGL